MPEYDSYSDSRSSAPLTGAAEGEKVDKSCTESRQHLLRASWRLLRARTPRPGTIGRRSEGAPLPSRVF